MSSTISKNLFLHPPFYHYRPKNTSSLLELAVNRKNTYWSKIYHKIDELYDKKPHILNKETILYRCSIFKNPLHFGKSFTGSKVIYFGLDFLISIWISLEIYERIKKVIPFYLHIYELKEDIHYKYVHDDIGTIPELTKPSIHEKYPCVHPQLIPHGNYYHTEVGTELTFPRTMDLKSILNPILTLSIDVLKLQKHQNTFLFEWNPANALSRISS